ncbi:hypothetical protein [Cohnella candidum]|uniref:Uncharacterized protein n=1 Tax=Cohnella candidum TaxID=2674991 RepID=A0A3G3K0U8_9BACL|nr:hypothetical protein [Cohnella candidum]AYQ74164.1 hypothetical protein EAV92_17295 [Cohnella candidum]
MKTRLSKNQMFSFFAKLEENRKVRIALIVIYVVLALLICLHIGLFRIIYSDFFPIDGDFQNFNGYRRLFAGQIPFKDFDYYLGLGPLYSNAGLLLLLGGNFTASLFATNFLTSFMLLISIYVVSRSNRRSPRTSLILTVLFLMMGCGMLPYFPAFSFLAYIVPGNSDRMVRAFLPFLVVFVAFLAQRPPVKGWADAIRGKIKHPVWISVLRGAMLGGCIPWSNDYGLSAFLAGFILYCALKVRWNWKSLLHPIVFIAGGLAGCFIMANVLTLGHFWNWFSYNFLGVASEQFWYYDTSPSVKLLTVHDIPFNSSIALGLVFMGYLLLKIYRAKHTREDLYLLFMLLTTLIAGYAYAFGSSKAGLFIPLQLVLFVSIVSKITVFRKRLAMDAILVAISLALIIPPIYSTLEQMNDTREVYVPQLHGYLKSYGPELQSVSQGLLQGKKVFSTYASALEVMMNQYQPSGIDYIIHVLGDDNRERYMRSLEESKPDFVTTVREDFNFYEIWAKRANWFFYREILQKYEPVALTPYSVIWKPLQTPATVQAKATVTMNRLAGNRVQFQVTVPDSQLSHVIVELDISYSSIWNANRIKGLGIKKIVSIYDGWSKEWNGQVGSYNVPESKQHLKIPVRIVNGTGEATLQSLPADLTRMDVTHSEISGMMRDVDYYDLDKFKADEYFQAANLTDANWMNGLKSDEDVLLMPNKPDVAYKIKNAKFIVAENGKKYPIDQVQMVDQNWIHILINQPVRADLEYPHKLKFVDK